MLSFVTTEDFAEAFDWSFSIDDGLIAVVDDVTGSVFIEVELATRSFNVVVCDAGKLDILEDVVGNAGVTLTAGEY